MNPLRKLALMAAVVGTALLAPATAGATPYTWTVMPTQSNATADYLNGAACPKVSFCLALGVQGPIPVSFAWNGSSWSVTQNFPGEADESYVDSVSCVSATFCLAVGYNFLGNKYGDQAAAWVWNGSRWSGGAVAQPSKWNQLYGVKCLSPTACEAVGGHSAHLTYGYHPLAEFWNGSTLTAQPVKGSVAGTLDGVACKSSMNCEAVGGGLAMRWNGTTWSAQKLPPVTGGVRLNSISCYRTGCTAVGTLLTSGGSETALAEAWNGSHWALQSPIGSGDPQGATGTFWNAVHCGSAANCTVVGTWADTASNDYTLAEEWNGHTWTQDTTPSPGSGGTYNDSLNALACTPGTHVCTAVGFGDSSVVFGIRN